MNQEFTNQVAEKFVLPPEAVGNVPLIELRGRETICIEHHRGIVEYTAERVKVAFKRGGISIIGARLSIVQMNRRRVEIRGCIRSLELE